MLSPQGSSVSHQLHAREVIQDLPHVPTWALDECCQAAGARECLLAHPSLELTLMACQMPWGRLPQPCSLGTLLWLPRPSSNIHIRHSRPAARLARSRAYRSEVTMIAQSGARACVWMAAAVQGLEPCCHSPCCTSEAKACRAAPAMLDGLRTRHAR